MIGDLISEQCTRGRLEVNTPILRFLLDVASRLETSSRASGSLLQAKSALGAVRFRTKTRCHACAKCGFRSPVPRLSTQALTANIQTSGILLTRATLETTRFSVRCAKYNAAGDMHRVAWALLDSKAIGQKCAKPWETRVLQRRR
jgi:hypothetical protein